MEDFRTVNELERLKKENEDLKRMLAEQNSLKDVLIDVKKALDDNNTLLNNPDEMINRGFNKRKKKTKEEKLSAQTGEDNPRYNKIASLDNVKALYEAGYNVADIADSLEVSISTVYSRLHQLGVYKNGGWS